MSFPFGRWVVVEGIADEPIIAFVYLDPQAGPSAKGGLVSQPNIATLPLHTIRLAPSMRLRELTSEEVDRYALPARPEWLRFYGAQPSADTAWRRDPLLAGKLHDQYPDDIQIVVHDGDPRRTRRPAERCWVRIIDVDPVPLAPGRNVYIAVLLNKPHNLQSVRAGDRLKFVAAGGNELLHVTDEYLRERARWRIHPCDKCGAAECFDPPSEMVKVRFPDTPADSVMKMFTSFCTFCGGLQQLVRDD